MTSTSRLIDLMSQLNRLDCDTAAWFSAAIRDWLTNDFSRAGLTALGLTATDRKDIRIAMRDGLIRQAFDSAPGETFAARFASLSMAIGRLNRIRAGYQYQPPSNSPDTVSALKAAEKFGSIPKKRRLRDIVNGAASAIDGVSHLQLIDLILDHGNQPSNSNDTI